LHEAGCHQFHQTCEIALRQPVTSQRTRALDQLAQLGVGREVDAKSISRKRLDFASTTTRVGRSGRDRQWPRIVGY
jgi:hypothetical protein